MKKTPQSLNNNSPSTEELLRELVAHLRRSRTQLREEWARRITEAKLLTAMSTGKIFRKDTTAVYDNYCRGAGIRHLRGAASLRTEPSERRRSARVETHRSPIGVVLLLRDVLARSLFLKYQTDFPLLNRILDAYEPAANRIANTVAVGFVQERERVIREQQEAIRILSAPSCRCVNAC